MKDAATAIGIGLGLVVIVTANVLEGGNPMSLLLLPPMLLVFGTTLLVTVAGGTMADAKGAVASLKRAFTGGDVKPAGDVVPAVVSLAEKARREGLLALEDMVKDVDDPFLVKGVTMAIDGTDPDEVRDILEAEVAAKRKADKQSAKFWADAGAYAPTIGIIGTVMGLVHVLENLASPEELGHLIAAAFVATLWGVMSANVLFLPLGNRLKRLGELEVARMEIVIEGVAAIQAGSNPRVIAAKLTSLLPAGEQPAAVAPGQAQAA
ncbi:MULTISPECIES: motility protein A [Nocardioides]|uniref:MotA/TolQ/ExbB proton channel family protein n=1 Tax=Nocardioides kribbensis TaxID=305517 RepID=A0ABV1NX56_9ACTN|nr:MULTISPECIES: MotA/TolQ/ExbB proton channel family protein [Nocardioides]KQP63310.1 flagellar motor protein MotA [Nocardioides sp. Leaf285]KQQ39747.1 flagellar motor protein MotA [Nocardioides sp. Leaf307]MCM3514810.1 MotA/TolQ/ExbB proton channel family protein [Nocardioides sp. P86]